MLMDEFEELKRMEEVTESPDKKVAIEFIYEAPEARQVFLAGSFNNWNTESLPMKKNKHGQWKATVKLLPGSYEYKYFADGVWATDKYCTEAGEQGAKCVIDVAPMMTA